MTDPVPSLALSLADSLPGIVSGMRISMAGAWTHIVAVELIAATNGVGYLIMQASEYLNVALVFIGIFAIALMERADPGCAGSKQGELAPRAREISVSSRPLTARENEADHHVHKQFSQ